MLARLVLTLGCAALGTTAPAQSRPGKLQSVASHPVIGSGVTGSDDARLRGSVLLGELGCVSCHDPGDRFAWIEVRRGPNLAAVGARVDPDYLVEFLAQPHETKPGTSMPDLVPRGKAEVLAQYLVSLASEPFARDEERVKAAGAQRGRALFHAIGCVACHAPRDEQGREVASADSMPLGALERKYSVDGLRAFLEDPHEVRPSGRMPDFHLSPQEASDLAQFLAGSRSGEGAERTGWRVDAAQIAAGRELFAELGCASCHSLEDRRRTGDRTDYPPLGDVDPLRGCLAEDVGRGAPRYRFAPSQRADLRAVLQDRSFAPSDEQRLQHTLLAYGCVACHERDEYGGVAEARNDFFTTEDGNLGEVGRLPPTLTGVGAKLQESWLHDAIAHGQRIRPYLNTRMPAFGEAAARSMVPAMRKLDRKPSVTLDPIPKQRDRRKAMRDLGRKLVGSDGMNCIACHTFGGRSASGMAAVDVADSTVRRLQRSWFHRYMLDPVGFQPRTIMPSFFPNGVSSRADLGGSAAEQIDAIWHYLSEGRNAPKPRGLVREPIELVVGDEAVMLRRKVQHTGKRGISVGYPLGVNLTFDAESLAIDQIWWGRFVDAAPVWRGQGSGAARILGRQRVVLPKGPAFVELADPSAAWPTQTRRDRGHSFEGYELDAKRRPTFRYVCDGVRVADRSMEVEVDDGRTTLRRELDFASERDKTIWFRAAVDTRIEHDGAGVVQVGDTLLIRAPHQAVRVHQDASGARELRIEVPILQGAAELELNYVWRRSK